jgi:hypothetical protein
MSTVVDSYRQSHPAAPRGKSRRWLLLGGLAGLITAGSYCAAVVTGHAELPAFAATETAPPPAPAVRAPVSAAKAKQPHQQIAEGILDGPVTGLIIAGIGLMTGVIVYLGLGRIVPVRGPEAHPYELVRSRREVTQERRYHAGPIRD